MFPADLIALLCAGLFAGASLYINLVEHPARLACGTALALKEFAPSYARATRLQASLAAVGGLAGIATWLLGGSRSWLLGAVLLSAVIPVTLVVIFPVNRSLLDPRLDPASSVARDLLLRWGRLHSVRTMLSLAAFVVFAWTFR